MHGGREGERVGGWVWGEALIEFEALNFWQVSMNCGERGHLMASVWSSDEVAQPLVTVRSILIAVTEY